MKEPGTRDHRRVVRREARARRKHPRIELAATHSHRGDEGAIARDTAAEDDTPTLELLHRSGSLLDQRLDQRVLKRAGNRCPRKCGKRRRRCRVANGVEHSCLQSAE